MSSGSNPEATNVLEYIPYLFDRPGETLLTGRKNIVFNIPDDMLIERYRPIKFGIQQMKTMRTDRAGPETTKVNVKSIDPPDLSEVEKIKRNESFCLFNPTHRERAYKLIRILMSMPDVESFFSVCVYARDRLNTQLYIYAISVAILRRKDTKSVIVPSNVRVFPQFYLNNEVFAKIREELAVIPEEDRRPILVQLRPTANDLDIEHRIAYWREDIGLNLHHWHWHLVYPNGYDQQDIELVKNDRRGELFYYMHQQMVARYNFERLSNQLARVRHRNNFLEPIMEGYYPKIRDLCTNRDYPSRQPFSYWKDVHREIASDGTVVEVNHLHRWRDVIMNDIMDKRLLNETGEYVSLDSEKGIDYLGNVVESSIFSINPQRYGDLHNAGHELTGYIHDPEYKYLEDVGAMGNNATAARDPFFYQWHAYIDDIFVAHKESLAPYTKEELEFSDITVQGITVKVDEGRDNKFITYFQQSEIEISPGLDYYPVGPVYVRFIHLQHAPFTYHIQVNNNGTRRNGTVRIFMAPRKDERNEEFIFKQQRRLFIELDRFVVTLQKGLNPIKRRSEESSVTIPFDQLFSPDMKGNENDDFCKCGWPDYLLIPKGHTQGLPADLFVMVSDAEKDFVPDKDSPPAFGKKCKSAPEYCGLRDKKYPDKRAMGYPFDRLPDINSKVPKLEEFVAPYKNMFVQKVDIKFDPKICYIRN
ncbi:hypothetical protein V9T40_002670 [Parthenolecanium corni]|uniref:Tyrosinase copper-binding domain-containing protein n=1 Tax=Parthenolecanium corni TaxID=536013 RepID=A0AAN9TUX5_9HEMI